MKGKINMRNQNPVLIAIVFALAFALAPVTQATRPDGGPLPRSNASNHQPSPGGGPAPAPANERVHLADPTSLEDVDLPVVTIHSAGNVLRGKIGSFVVDMKPALMFGGTYVNFSVKGTAIAGVDYVALVSPTYLGQTGYGVISFATLPNPRAGSPNQVYSVVVTLEAGPGYVVGEPKSATIYIKDAQ
jgi:hypothetical protein